VNAVLLRPAPPATDAVGLFFDTLPDRPFTEVAVVQALGSGADAHPQQMLVALQDKGKALGCNAIVRIDLTNRAGSAHAVGVCVVWLPGKSE